MRDIVTKIKNDENLTEDDETLLGVPPSRDKAELNPNANLDMAAKRYNQELSRHSNEAAPGSQVFMMRMDDGYMDDDSEPKVAEGTNDALPSEAMFPVPRTAGSSPYQSAAAMMGVLIGDSIRAIRAIVDSGAAASGIRLAVLRSTLWPAVVSC